MLEARFHMNYVYDAHVGLSDVSIERGAYYVRIDVDENKNKKLQKFHRNILYYNSFFEKCGWGGV